MKICIRCGEDITPKQRYTELNLKTCLKCGDSEAVQKSKQYTIVPMNKSNYMLVTDLDLLKQLNPKRTT